MDDFFHRQLDLRGTMPCAAPANCVCQAKTTPCRVLREHSLPVLPRLRRRWCGLILPLLGSERSATNRWPGEYRVQPWFCPR